TGFLSCDEHFQILEFAASKLGFLDPEVLPWEIEASSRQWLQPFLYWLWLKPFVMLGVEDRFVLVTISRILTAGITAGSVIALGRRWAAASQLAQQYKKIILLSLTTAF